MLANARLYQDEIRKEFYKIWYDPKYQYYFGGEGRWDFQVGNNEYHYDFASVDKDGNLLGYISYSFDHTIRLANCFGAINFSEDKITFGRDLRTVINDLFMKFNAETLEFNVIIGNPAERSYDRIIKRIGGKVLCIRHARAKDLAGHNLDDKVYEVTREDYLKHTKER